MCLPKAAFSCWLVLLGGRGFTCHSTKPMPYSLCRWEVHACGWDFYIDFTHFSIMVPNGTRVFCKHGTGISISIVKCCKHMLSVEKNMCIWPRAFTWGVMSYKVMLLWREHPAAMSAVPLSTATSAVTKRSSTTQALLQCLPSAFPLKCCQKMLFVDRKMWIWSLAFHWERLCCKVMPG